MEADPTWRDILSAVIADPGQRQQLADKLNVNPIVLRRWAAGMYQPPPDRLHQLCSALPGHAELRRLVAAEFPDFDRGE
jgi:ribosome-binding protein aMBF1 (putative translation factor)